MAACGGSGTATLTKQQYASKLSRLCLLAADQLRELHLDNTVPAWRADGHRIVAIEQSFNRKLAALKPPHSIQAAYTKANEGDFRDTEAAVAAAKAGDANGLRAAVRRANRDNLATAAPAREIGAAGCYIGWTAATNRAP